VQAPAMIFTSILNHLQKAEKTMSAKQAPSKEEKTPKHNIKTTQSPKHIRKNCETTTEENPTEKTT
jgi:hypothetical protein